MILSILICTIPQRKELFETLIKELARQMNEIEERIEIKWNPEPRGKMTIGKKRQILLEESTGEYIVYFDDDDFPEPNYMRAIIEALKDKPDCVGLKIRMTTNGANEQTCIHSLVNKTWRKENNVYYRNVTHFNPVKREIAIKVGFEDIAFGEDKLYSDLITPFCETEVFIDEFLFNYRYTNHESHNDKYGIQ